MYMSLGDICEVQIDHTGRCNLQCPQCARTSNNWSQLPENKGLDLSVDDYKIILEPFEENKLKIFHCGNYGDALASPTFDETFDYSLSKNPRQIVIVTNGSLRSPSWWSELARKGQQKLKVAFSIDGLSDTNAIYRIGSNYEKIMKNVKAFIDAGGRARWDFIEFKHNYHQIEEARKIASAMGFEEFNIKYTARFASQGTTFVNKKNQERVEDLKTNKNQQDHKQIVRTYGSFDEYVEKTNISCKSMKNKNVFIDMHMRLWPCCWFGAPMYFQKVSEQTKSFDHFLNLYGKDFNNLRVHGWKVLEHEFYQTHLESSWNSPTDKYKRIYTCGRTCGDKFEFSSGYGQNRNVKTIKTAEA